MNENLIEQIKTDYGAGMSYRQLAKKYRMSFRDLAKILKDGRTLRENIQEHAKLEKEKAESRRYSLLFKLFDEGKLPAEVVKETEENPRFAEKAWKTYVRLKGYLSPMVQEDIIGMVKELGSRVEALSGHVKELDGKLSRFEKTLNALQESHLRVMILLFNHLGMDVKPLLAKLSTPEGEIFGKLLPRPQG